MKQYMLFHSNYYMVSLLSLLCQTLTLLLFYLLCYTQSLNSFVVLESVVMGLTKL